MLIDIHLIQTYLGISAALLKYVNSFKRVFTYLLRYLLHMFPIIQISQHCFFTAHISWIISLHFPRYLRSSLHISFTRITPRPAPALPDQWARPRFLNINATAVQVRARCVIDIKQCHLMAGSPAAPAGPAPESKAYAAKRRSQNSIRELYVVCSSLHWGPRWASEISTCEHVSVNLCPSGRVC